MNPKGFAPIIVVLLIMVVVLGAGTYFWQSHKTIPATSSNLTSSTPAPTLAPTLDNRPPLSGQIFSGKIQKLSQNLGLILTMSPTDPGTQIVQPDVTYYTAGVYTQGKYTGYTRYLAIYGEGLGTSSDILASKDGKNFIVDNSSGFGADPLANVDKTKVTGVDSLDSEHPTTISLDSHFALIRNEIVTFASNNQIKDVDGTTIGQTLLASNFANYPVLKSTDPNLTIYGNNTTHDFSLYQGPPLSRGVIDNFLSGTTEVVAVDSTGLPYSYTETTMQMANSYSQAIAKYYQDVKNNQINPTYPEYPNLHLQSSQISTQTGLYNTYNVAIPSACAAGRDETVVKNVSLDDLQKIGTSPYGDIYTLKDNNHQLNKSEYDAKVGWGLTDNQDFVQTNQVSPPSFDSYMNKPPLIFFQDYWGRWVALGEYDYKLLGGCGKPVVYLYPPKPTTISLKFLTPIIFDRTIPNYHDGWQVLAQPDGTLTDLQTQYTLCNLIDSHHFGSEYAQTACQKNQYPYLYWAGSSPNRFYPAITSGWIVSQDKLTNFMNQTLDNIGFNAKEKSDFLSYWLPQMLSHQAAYYRINFLQNSQMDEIAPMQITPHPDHYYRYFLDYSPLNSKPSAAIPPENLIKIKRDGFTLVEWGGKLLP